MRPPTLGGVSGPGPRPCPTCAAREREADALYRLVDRLVWAVDHMNSGWPPTAAEAYRIVTEARQVARAWHDRRVTGG